MMKIVIFKRPSLSLCASSQIKTLVLIWLLIAISTLSVANAEQAYKQGTHQRAMQQGMALVQQKEWAKAEPYFAKAAEDGDGDALFWLGMTQQKQSGQKAFQAGRTYLAAAKAGNPWAMEMLNPNKRHSPCSFFAWPCDADWEDKAIEGWQQRAKNGDGASQYKLAYSLDSWTKLIPIYGIKRSREQLELAYQLGYLKAAEAIAGEIEYREDKKTPEVRKEIVSYLLKAAEGGYAPAMVDLYFYYDVIGDKAAIDWLQRAVELGYPKAAFIYASGSDEELIIMQRQLNRAKAPRPLIANRSNYYYYAKIHTGLGGDDFKFYFRDGSIKEGLTEAEIEVLNQKAAEFLSRVKPNNFIDENSSFYE